MEPHKNTLILVLYVNWCSHCLYIYIFFRQPFLKFNVYISHTYTEDMMLYKMFWSSGLNRSNPLPWGSLGQKGCIIYVMIIDKCPMVSWFLNFVNFCDCLHLLLKKVSWWEARTTHIVDKDMKLEIKLVWENGCNRFFSRFCGLTRHKQLGSFIELYGTRHEFLLLSGP